MPPGYSPTTVLLVEPEREFARAISEEIFRVHESAKVSLVSSIEGALVHLRSVQLRLVLIDETLMPGGVARLSAELEALGARRCVPIVALNRPTEVSASYVAGAHSVLARPEDEERARQMISGMARYWLVFNLVPALN